MLESHLPNAKSSEAVTPSGCLRWLAILDVAGHLATWLVWVLVLLIAESFQKELHVTDVLRWKLLGGSVLMMGLLGLDMAGCVYGWFGKRQFLLSLAVRTLSVVGFLYSMWLFFSPCFWELADLIDHM